jgi:hypothetical protein
VNLSRRARFSVYAVSAFVLTLAVIAAVLVLRFQPIARDYIISALQDRYHGDVTLGDLQISLLPSVRATGENLEVRLAGRPDLPPVVSVRQFILNAGFIGFFRNPKRISLVRLDGLEIHTPPRSNNPTQNRPANPKFAFVLDEVIADSATLITTPSDPAKDPLVFHIRELTMHSVGIGQPMTFHAKVENAKPPGLIHTDGHFGPWNADQPRETPLSGHYTFRGADLGVFRGIAGTLSSDGDYQGQLDELAVRGTADVPDFALDIGGHPMHLQTEFDATVDGASGDTRLHPVRARLGDSIFEVSGSIARNALEKHREIVLDARANGAGLDDFLCLTVKAAQPPMTGRISFTTKVKIPPGDYPVVDRIQLDGHFALNSVRFTSPDVQSKIAGLSHHAQGEPDNHDPNVTAEFNGDFHLKNAQLTLPRFAFHLPGANITLAGAYGLRSSAINFQGTAKLDAPVSRMTTGIKRVLLKPIDPLFRRDGAGTVLPIHIQGTRGQPSFGIDIGRVLKRQ